MEIFIIFLSFIQIALGIFPNYLEKCKIEDSVCLKRVGLEILSKYYNNGINELNIPPFDPYYLKSLGTKDIESNIFKEYNLQFDLKNVYFFGLSSVKIEKLEFKRKNNKIRLLLDFTLPVCTIIADYVTNGTLLNILPVEGNGSANYTIVNPFFTNKYFGHLVTFNNKRMIKTDKLRTRYNATKIHTYLGNIFNGDKILGRTVNEFLDVNWKELYDTLGRPFFEIFAFAFRDLADRVFNSISYDELFLL